MGFDIDRVRGEVKHDIICSICLGVLEAPLQTILCKHVFCANCIQKWLERSKTCPLDRNPLAFNVLEFETVSDPVVNLLSRLSVTCEYASRGCNRILKMCEYAWHVTTECPYNSTLLRLSSSLANAHVKHWGALISEPKLEEQRDVVTSLSDMGWPADIVMSVIINCGENRWPKKLRSGILRFNNRPLIEKYVCRRIPGQQAVIILGWENEHMPKDVIVQPAMIMIFDHGII